MMNEAETLKWLFNNGNAIIRYKAATELSDEPEVYDVEVLERDLLAHEEVKYWLGCITGKTDRMSNFHNSPDTCFENCMGKLSQFGIKTGMPALDEKTKVYLENLPGLYEKKASRLMSHFKTAWESRWFKSCVEHLEKFRTENGTYRFPKHYLKERRNSYFVTGGHTGLGENRRKKITLEIESTFWMMKIKKDLKQSGKNTIIK
ncbi:hypothetical protein JXI42_06255 [bacterium]|nr:hypothetical protein [bacterium]